VNVNVNVNDLVPVRDLSVGWGGRLSFIFTFIFTFIFARADVIARVLELAVGSWLAYAVRCRPPLLLSVQSVFLLESASPGGERSPPSPRPTDRAKSPRLPRERAFETTSYVDSIPIYQALLVYMYLLDV